MKLYIDMIAFYLQKAGGITSVWKELLVRMLRDRKDIILILQHGECENIYFEQIMSYQPKVIYEKGNSININRYKPITIKFEENAGFISTYYRYALNRNIKQFVLVHDFTYEYYVKGVRKWVHSWQKRQAVKHAKVTICVSENTQSDMLFFYPWAKSKENYVIYNGANEIYHRKDNAGNVECLGKFNEIPFLLYVGSRAKYKRFDFAVEVAAAYAYPLVIIGGGEFSAFEQEMMKNELGNNFLHLKGISDEALNDIYNKAFALIYPSEYEGFGIPIIEAQRAGCPVIAYACAAISEIVGDTEILLKSNDKKECQKLITKLKDKKFRDYLKDMGYKNSKKYSWDKTYLEYEKIVFGDN